MGFIDDIKTGTANMFLGSDMAIDFVNNYTKRYATVKNIRLNGTSVECTATPNGSHETVTVKASGFAFADDNSSVSIGKLTADMPWVENALQDFAQGVNFPIPEAGRGMVSKIRAFL